MPRRAIGPTATIYAWLEQHPNGAQWDALLAWVRAVAIDWELCVSSTWEKPETNRRFHLSHIAVANTCAVFAVVDTPVRAIHILRFDDTLFEP